MKTFHKINGEDFFKILLFQNANFLWSDTLNEWKTVILADL